MNLTDASSLKVGSQSVSAVYCGGTPIWPPTSTEVNSWTAAIAAAGLPAPSAPVVTAARNLVNALYAANIRQKIFRLNLFAGGDWRSSFFPLIRDVGPAWDWNGRFGSTVADLGNASAPFIASDWSLAGGFDPSRINQSITGTQQNANGAYIDTGIPMNHPSFTGGSIHLACHVNSLGVKADVADFLSEMGALNNGAALLLRANYKSYFNATRGTPGFLTYGSLYASDGPHALLYTADNFPFDPRGFSIGTRTSLNWTAFYKNGYLPSAYYTGTQHFFNPNSNLATVPSMDATTITIFSDGYGRGGSGPGGLGVTRPGNRNYSDRQITMYSIGTGLTDTEIAAFTAAIADFNAAIGRTNY